jgi:hypothetical protein
MSVEVRVQQQARKSLALRVTPEGVVALIPRGLDPAGPQVRGFIERGLRRLPQPASPPEFLRQGQDEPLTPQALRDLVATWAGRVGVQVARVRIREMRTKWASCSSRGTITLGRDLLRLPRDLVEYVVCHELVHLKIPGHGKGWQALMGMWLPDWREREERLAGWVLGGGQVPGTRKSAWHLVCYSGSQRRIRSLAARTSSSRRTGAV